MTTINYLDFDLLIEGTPEKYTARVLNSPAGQSTADFHLPFSDLELENFYLRIGRPRRGVRLIDSTQMQATKTFGARLFKAVFADDVLECFHNSLVKAESQRHGLRLRLRLNAPELNELPWEFLYMPAQDRFLSLAVETPVVRYLQLLQSIRPLKVKPPLKILVMVSSPADFPPLNVNQEWSNLKNALADLEQRRLVNLERLEEATLTALQRRLRREEFHIFHFIGHGMFDEQTQDGVLLLEDQSRRGRRVSGKDMGIFLHNHQSLRLAVLNACEGARTSRSDPFAGTAQSLLRQGIPAVIAMQFEITDAAAITFAQEFYAAIADGYPVDAALVEVRALIFAHGNGMEWGTPVLYMRAPDGHIFDVEQIQDEQSFPQEDENLKSPEIDTFVDEINVSQLTAAPAPPISKSPKPWWRRRWRISIAISISALLLLVLVLLKDWKSPSDDKNITGPIPPANQPRVTRQDSLYAEYRREGEELLKQIKFAEAKSKFEAALEERPGDEYILDQLKKITTQIDAAEREKLYKKYKAEGEAFFNQAKYDAARLRYQDALNQKPGDDYVTGKINECHQKIEAQADEAKREKLYAEYRDAGDDFFKQGNYAEAKGQYELAQSYKPNDSYAAERIRECSDKLAAGQKSTPQEFPVPAGMVQIPGGYFIMGGNDNDDEKPAHRVYVSAFYMDKHEVTVEQYWQFLQANPGNRTPDYFYEQLQYPRHPIIYVSWDDAAAYARWQDKRLPTEAEWEYAARGGFTGMGGKPIYKYPSGNEINTANANYDADGFRRGEWESANRSLKDVESYPPNRFGLFDMAGNVWEWCRDWYDKSYYKILQDSVAHNPPGPLTGKLRVIRGGAWHALGSNLRCARRSWFDPKKGEYNLGFRCVREAR